MPTKQFARPPSFTAEVTSGSSTATVRVAGEVDAETSPAMADALLEAGAQGRRVLLDLDEVTFIDSAGIRVLLGARRALTSDGATLQVVEASPVVERILRVTGVFDVLQEAS